MTHGPLIPGSTVKLAVAVQVTEEYVGPFRVAILYALTGKVRRKLAEKGTVVSRASVGDLLTKLLLDNCRLKPSSSLLQSPDRTTVSSVSASSTEHPTRLSFVLRLSHCVFSFSLVFNSPAPLVDFAFASLGKGPIVRPTLDCLGRYLRSEVIIHLHFVHFLPPSCKQESQHGGGLRAGTSLR